MSGKINLRAIMAGLMAGLASCVTKLALAPDAIIPMWCRNWCLDSYYYDDHNKDLICWIAELIPRGLLFLCTILFNLMMVATFLNGMEECGSMVATALSTAANFSISVRTIHNIIMILLCIMLITYVM